VALFCFLLDFFLLSAFVAVTSSHLFFLCFLLTHEREIVGVAKVHGGAGEEGDAGLGGVVVRLARQLWRAAGDDDRR
jgi:hypothetical protein